MYVEIIQDFKPYELKKTNKDYNQKLPNITTPNVNQVSLTKSPVSMVGKAVLTASDIVNQKSILNQYKIQKEYNEIYNNTNQSKRISKTSYKKLNCIYGEEDDRHIIITRKRTDLSSLYSRIEKKKFPSQYKLSNIPTNIANEIQNRTQKMVKLSSEEMKQMKNIYRKGITIDNFKNVTNDRKKEEIFDLFKKKKPVKNFLFKKQGTETQIYEVIENNFKSVLELSSRQIKLSQEAMEREVMLEFAKDFKIIEPHHFAKEFRTCEEIIEFEKLQEMKIEYLKSNKRKTEVCEILDTIDRGYIC
jgi:hypothetical protein